MVTSISVEVQAIQAYELYMFCQVNRAALKCQNYLSSLTRDDIK